MAASSLEGGGMAEKDLRTRGDNSLSTLKARRAADARRGVGSGRSIVLVMALVQSERSARGEMSTVSRGNRGLVEPPSCLSLEVYREIRIVH